MSGCQSCDSTCFAFWSERVGMEDAARARRIPIRFRERLPTPRLRDCPGVAANKSNRNVDNSRNGTGVRTIRAGAETFDTGCD